MSSHVNAISWLLFVIAWYGAVSVTIFTFVKIPFLLDRNICILEMHIQVAMNLSHLILCHSESIHPVNPDEHKQLINLPSIL